MALSMMTLVKSRGYVLVRDQTIDATEPSGLPETPRTNLRNQPHFGLL
jgi:hypothetical protein